VSEYPHGSPHGHPETNGVAARLLRGAVECHVHSFPDVVERRLDDLDLVEQARIAGLRAIVLKSHVCSTCERAYLLNRLQPDVQVLGGVVLNDTVGGLNPSAVEAALDMGARQIWMPTKSAANHQQHYGQRGGVSIFTNAAPGRADSGGSRINGSTLYPALRDILRLVADADAVLATGHLAPEESRVLIEEALAAGVRRVSVTHPEWEATAMPIAVQQDLARTGVVYFERCLVSIETDLHGHVPFDAILQQIRTVGVDTTIAATDYGMPHYPAPVDGLRHYIERLLAAGFDETAIRRMTQDNPARLLGLEPAP
jgi:hypothetical protein